MLRCSSCPMGRRTFAIFAPPPACARTGVRVPAGARGPWTGAASAAARSGARWSGYEALATAPSGDVPRVASALAQVRTRALKLSRRAADEEVTKGKSDHEPEFQPALRLPHRPAEWTDDRGRPLSRRRRARPARASCLPPV